MVSFVFAIAALFACLASLVAGYPNAFVAATPAALALRPRQTGSPTFNSSIPSCPICQAAYPGISSCAAAAPALQNLSVILLDPFAFLDVIKCACTDTFESAYPQCVDCFERTNQSQFLDPSNSANLSSIVTGMRSVCAIASSLLGGVASTDGEIPTSSTSTTAPTATGTSGAVFNMRFTLEGLVGGLVAVGFALAL